MNALAPAEVAKVVLDENRTHRSGGARRSIGLHGRRGQNVRLASQLCGWDIDILTEEVDRTSSEEFLRRSRSFVEALDASGRRGFRALRSRLRALDDLVSIEGYDEEVAREPRTRQSFLARREFADKCKAAASPGRSLSRAFSGNQTRRERREDLDDFADLDKKRQRPGHGHGVRTRRSPTRSWPRGLVGSPTRMRRRKTRPSRIGVEGDARAVTPRPGGGGCIVTGDDRGLIRFVIAPDTVDSGSANVFRSGFR